MISAERQWKSMSSETKICVLCGELTGDIVYTGRVRECGKSIHFGRCCKEAALEKFKTLHEAGIAWAKLHGISCHPVEEKEIVDETDKPQGPLMNESFMNKIRAEIKARGKEIDENTIVVVSMSDLGEEVNTLLGELEEFAGEAPDCAGKIIGKFDGMPVIARWDIPPGDVIICHKDIVPDRDEMPN